MARNSKNTKIARKNKKLRRYRKGGPTRLDMRKGGRVSKQMGGNFQVNLGKAYSAYKGTLTDEVRKNIQAAVKKGNTSPEQAAINVSRGWTADPERKKEADRLKKLTADSEVAQEKQRLDQIQKERDART